ncbi:hypothetical protein [Thalassotalea euphylliae]|uniref:DUF91 domain-containing protein n=1 Tax=Thalassotalea euphylliae TaxID=1655234 RepID=A0A3E0UCH5_9GAMM|nr:hypothetical protein [Thalassotalea euphylliae]REL34698.1 hypothetical protein DXX92_04625 [Thalassotalea euphylliae]
MTKILRHFTANDEQLEPFNFKRELSMESYLVENEGVLGLDNDVFASDRIAIIEEELTLKQGRASKDTDGRIDILATYSDEYIAVIELKLGQLEDIHLVQLEDYLKQKHQIIEEYPDIISQEASTTPSWIGVLVGSSISPELAAKITNGYLTSDGIPIAALTLQRFRSSRGNVYVTTDTYFKNNSNSKDTTKYLFDGEEYGKGRLVLAVIQRHIELNSEISYAELAKQFPKRCQGSKGVFTSATEANEIYTSTGRKRHFIAPEELIELSDSTIAVCTQWGVKNIDKFISRAVELGHKIMVAN